MKLSYSLLLVLVCATGTFSQAQLSAQDAKKPDAKKPDATESSAAKATAPKASAAVQIAGTKVKLVVPKGFGVTSTFPGIMNPALGSSVLVSEVANPFVDVSAGFSDAKRLAASKMTVHSREQRKQGQYDGLLLQVDQDAGHILVRKWIWVFGDDKNTVMVMGSCMKNHAAGQLPVLREAVTSARWDLRASVDVFEGLPFRLHDIAGLKYSSRVGYTVCLTLDGKPDLKRENKAMLLVGPSFGDVKDGVAKITDRRAFARERVEWLPYAYPVIEEPEAIEIDGMKGYVMKGVGLNKAKKKVAIYGVVLFDGKNYWMIHGSVIAKEEAKFMPVFDRIARSLKRSPKAKTAKN